MGSLYERFRALEDPRGGHGLHHRAASTLACAAVATLLGAGSYQGYEDICKRLTYRQRRALHCYHDRKNDLYVAPSDSTFYRVLCLIDPAHFESIVSCWLLEQEIGQLERLSVDGKVLRGTGREDGKPLALLSAVLDPTGSIAVQYGHQKGAFTFPKANGSQANRHTEILA